MILKADKQAQRLPELPSRPKNLAKPSHAVYRPQIMTFVYRMRSAQNNPLAQADRSLLLSSNCKGTPTKKQTKIKVVGSKQGQLKDSSHHGVHYGKKVKIKLVSSRYNRVIGESKCPKRGSREFQVAQMEQLPNHIVVEDFAENITCDILGPCHDLSFVDQGQFSLKAYEDSRQTLHNRTAFLPVSAPSKCHSEHSGQLSSSSHYTPFQRKNIFEQGRIAETSDSHSFLDISQKSITRKSIFKPRNKTQVTPQKHALKAQPEVSAPLQMSRFSSFGLADQKKFLEERQIPKTILESWQNFSESQASWGDSSQDVEENLQGSEGKW